MISVQQLLDAKPNQSVWCLNPDQMVLEALELMAAHNIGAVVLLRGEELAGIFSERDYARKGIITGRKAQKTPLSEVMTSPVFTVSPDMDIDDCMQLYSAKRIRHLPVVEAGKVVGMLSIGDIVAAIIKEQNNHIQFLEQYITTT